MGISFYISRFGMVITNAGTYVINNRTPIITTKKGINAFTT
jgi:hypothetical protein